MRESENERKTNDGDSPWWIRQADSPGIRNVILAHHGQDIIALVYLEAAAP